MQNLNQKLKTGKSLSVGEVNFLSNLEKDNKSISGLIEKFMSRFIIKKGKK